VTGARRVVFLDRDGVLTVPVENSGKGYAPRSVAQLNFYSDAANSVLRLKEVGYDVVIVTNQPDVSSGHMTHESLEEIHAKVREYLGVESINTCPHARSDSCRCRKPLSDLLLREDAIEPVDFSLSWMVGDRDSDIESGISAGCRTIFIDRGWVGEIGSKAEVVVREFSEAVDAILNS
jgi:D-glycero-D-manno-heptose 1,7-bisphosphate phosphatase